MAICQLSFTAEPDAYVVVERVIRADEEERNRGHAAKSKEPCQADLSFVADMKVPGDPDHEDNGPYHDAAESHYPEEHAAKMVPHDDEHGRSYGHDTGPKIIRCAGRTGSICLNEELTCKDRGDTQNHPDRSED